MLLSSSETESVIKRPLTSRNRNILNLLLSLLLQVKMVIVDCYIGLKNAFELPAWNSILPGAGRVEAFREGKGMQTSRSAFGGRHNSFHKTGTAGQGAPASPPASPTTRNSIHTGGAEARNKR